MSLLGNNIIILYYSKENHTKMLAKRIFDIFREFVPNHISIKMMDARKMEKQELLDAKGYIIGSPDYFDYVSGHIKLFFDDFYDERDQFRGKPAFGFITHGGGAKAHKYLSGLLKAFKFEVIDPLIVVKLDDISSKIESQIQKNCLKMLKIVEDSLK